VRKPTSGAISQLLALLLACVSVLPNTSTAQVSTATQNLLLACKDYSGVQGYKPYDEKENTAWFIVTPLGGILDGPTVSIDEDDKVLVTVLADPKLLMRLTVRRTSEIRSLGALNIIGATGEPGGADRTPSSEQPNVCGFRTFALRDFQPGRATVEISILEQGKDLRLGTFEFVVSRLYHGMLSIGPVVTWGQIQSYQIVESAGQPTIATTESGDVEVQYPIFFTYFVWGKRDIEKPPQALLHRLNPTIGVSTEDVGDNAFGGGSLDFGALLLTGGIHFAKTRILAPESGLEVGSVFPGTTEEIPTSRKWKGFGFGGITVDVRAMVALLHAAIK